LARERVGARVGARAADEVSVGAEPVRPRVDEAVAGGAMHVREPGQVVVERLAEEAEGEARVEKVFDTGADEHGLARLQSGGAVGEGPPAAAVPIHPAGAFACQLILG